MAFALANEIQLKAFQHHEEKGVSTDMTAPKVPIEFPHFYRFRIPGSTDPFSRLGGVERKVFP